jgi:hypothetical protein
MIHSLRYEPQGQRQRFEPREQQHDEFGSRQIHLHLHLHLNLGQRMHRASQTTIGRLTALFAAFLGALSMALTLFLQVNVRMISMQAPLFSWAGNLILIGALLGLGAVLLGGLPLVISAWRSTPRSRFLFLVPFLALGLTFAVIVLGTYIPDPIERSALLVVPLYVLPFICTLTITRAIRQAQIAGKWLRFANRLSPLVVLGMLLMLIGVLLWGFALALFAPDWFFILLPLHTFPWNSWFLIALGMLIAFLIAVFAFFSPLRARSHATPHQEPPGAWD